MSLIARKPVFRVSDQVLTQTRLHNKRWLDASKEFSKNRNCTIYVAKTKALRDQLHGCRAADLCLCFCICKNQLFS